MGAFLRLLRVAHWHETDASIPSNRSGAVFGSLRMRATRVPSYATRHLERSLRGSGRRRRGPAGINLWFARGRNCYILDGRFEFRSLAAGQYRIVVPALDSFVPSRTALLLRPGTESVTVTLVPLAETQTVVAHGAEDLSPDASSNRDAVSVSGASLERLPVLDQDYVSA